MLFTSEMWWWIKQERTLPSQACILIAEDSKQVKEKVRCLQGVQKVGKVIKARWHDERSVLGVFLEVSSEGAIDADS